MISMRLITYLHVHVAPKSDIIYSRGRSKSVTPSRRRIGISDNERNPEYAHLGIRTPTLVARATQGTLQKVVSSVITISHYDE